MLECYFLWGIIGLDLEFELNWFYIWFVGLDDLVSFGSVYLFIYLGGGL